MTLQRAEHSPPASSVLPASPVRTQAPSPTFDTDARHASPRVYMAGPDVFYRDRDARFAKLEQLCQARGLHAVLPLDSQPLPTHLADPDLAVWLAVQNRDVIRGRNMPQLQRCDAVVANLQPFRGLWADTGTCVEIGIAAGLDIPVFTYGADARSYRKKLEDRGDTLALDAHGLLRDQDHILVENLGQPENAMIHGLAACFESATQALDAVKDMVAANRQVALHPAGPHN